MNQRKGKIKSISGNRPKSTVSPKKKQSTVLVSVFHNPKQERLFATVANNRMSKDSRLGW